MNGYVRKKSLRLKHYDYCQPGFYFITVCTYNRKHLFGSIENGVMRCNVAGEMVKHIWYEIPLFYKGFVLHEFVVMPNHIHGIIEIVGTTPPCLSDTNNEKQLSISDLIHRFKTLTTSKYIDGVHPK